MNEQPTVFVVDDDRAVREALRLLLEGAGFRAALFADARQFLEHYVPGQPGCLLLDVRMPGMSGLELQQRLARNGISPPVIIITGHGDVPMAVRAMKSGAVDFFEKPFSGRRLLERVRQALRQDAHNRRRQLRRLEVAGRIAALSPREREIMERVTAGQYNKVIAAALGISISTVEAHRKRVMEKLQAESLPDLVRIVKSQQSVAEEVE